MSVAKWLASRRLLVCVGPGGVGKTTVAAALAMLAASQGRRVFVLTIDPARRLADALGLDGLDDTTRRVPVERAGVPFSGNLHAAMVESGASFDALIERIAPDEHTRQRVLANRVYRIVSRSLARSHAYVAMERLYHAITSEDHDLVVLDTPPARNAVEILDAPQRLARLLDAKIIEWLMPERATAHGFAARLRARGGEMALSLLRRVTGAELLAAIVEFLELFGDLREGFRERAVAVDRTLRDAQTGYVLVGSTSPSSIDDAAWLRDDLRTLGIEIEAMVFNASYRVLDRFDERRIVTSVPPLADDAIPDALHDDAALLARVRALRMQAAAANADAEPFIAGMRAELSPGTLVIRTPRFEKLRDLRDLHALAAALAEGAT